MNKKIGSVFIDLTKSRKYYNPCTQNSNIEKDALFWFLLNSNDLLEIEGNINNDFKFAFQVIWICSTENSKNKSIKDIYILHVVSLGSEYYFNKDPIREKHIWKDIEWGKRKKNYNPLGKDPGTVWIKIKDDNKGHIIEHKPFFLEEILKRIKLSSLKNDQYVLKVIDK